MKIRLLCLFALLTSASAAFAQANPGPCNDPWISLAYKSLHWTANGGGTAGECAPTRYGNATWGNYANAEGVLNQWVSGSRTCADPWIGEAYTTAMGRLPNAAAGECNASLYGTWGSNFVTLINNIKQYQQRVAASVSKPVATAPRPVAPAPQPFAPAPRPSAPATVQVPVSSFHFVSAMGGKCLDVEGNSTASGARIIAYNCQRSNYGAGSQFQVNQEFAFTRAGEIRTFAGGTVVMCMEDKGGLIRSMDSVDSWPCNGQPNQKWTFVNGMLHPASNSSLCLDLRGGSQNWYIGNQDAILYPCGEAPGQHNQHFVAAVFAGNGTAVNSISPGAFSPVTVINPNPSVFVGNNGSAIVAAGAGNIVGPSGGTIVAAGAGNVVNTNGSNIVAAGAGNIVAAGAGNIVVAGGQLVPVATSAQFQ